MPIKSIPRVSLPSQKVFFEKYVSTREPVIITDMFKGQEIDQIRSLSEARVAFENIKLLIQPEYLSEEEKSHEGGKAVMTFGQYWDHAREHPLSKLLCTEYEMPARIMAAFQLPQLCYNSGLGNEEIFGLPKKYGDFDLFLNLFVARQGSVAQLHYDGDQREVLLHQVFGRKQVVLFQPKDGIHLKCFERGPGFSGYSLNKMDMESREKLLEVANGYEATLYPGDTIYMPQLIWHYLEYLDDAMSFNIRFNRNNLNRFLCVDHFHRDYYMQNFACHLNNRATHEHVLRNALPLIISAYLEPKQSLPEKVKCIRSLFRSLCDEIIPEAAVEKYCPISRDDEDIGKIVADIGSSLRYTDPEVLKHTRLQGPASPLQINRLMERVQYYGYSASTLERLLLNRLGKNSIKSLSKAEAAQFMSFMASPGAAMNC